MISVVIVTYNSADWLGRAVSALRDATRDPVELIVVDNASSDATLAVVHRAAPDAVILPLDENVGFATACNLAASKASGEFLLFLNPDTEVRPGALDAARDYLQHHPGVGVVGGRTVFEDGTLNPTCCFGEPSLWSAFCYAVGLASVFPGVRLVNSEYMGASPRTDTRSVDIVTGCFLMIRRSLFEALDGFDERFFMYSEDADLCRRVREMRLDCVHVADVELVHAGGASDSVRSAKFAKVMQARSQYYAKHWSAPAARLGSRLIDLAVFLRMVASRVLGESVRREHWSEVWAARELWRDPSRRRSRESALGADDAPGEPPVHPKVRVECRSRFCRARIVAQLARHVVRSTRSRDLDFVADGAGALVRFPIRVAADVVGPRPLECNVCGARVSRFYANVGPGYNEPDTLCPGCTCLDRHRSLLALLVSQTTCLNDGSRIVEVAPMRGFDSLLAGQPGVNYTSFDLTRRAMEHGDITAMRYATESVDCFLCFHVLEHIPDDGRTLDEIWRVLKRGGTAVFQVPIDWDRDDTYEYGQPDPRDVGHVRRYGRDFGRRLAAKGFAVRDVSVVDVYSPETIRRFGLSPEPIYFAQRPAGDG